MRNSPRHIPTVFAIPLKDLSRLDVSYSLVRASAKGGNRRVPLGDITTEVRYGSSVRATSEPHGIPIIRMGNIVDGGLDLRDLKYVQLQKSDRERLRLSDGDVLINRTNTKELVGKSAVFHERGQFVYASYIIRVRLSSEADPDYVSGWLNSPDARLQIDKVSRRIAGMTNINSQEIRALQVPLPSLQRQRALAAELEGARQSYLALLRQVDEILDGVSLEVLGLLRTEDLRVSRPLVYAVPATLVRAGGRLDVWYNHPERIAAIEAIQSRPYALLGDLAEVRADRASQGAENALSLGNVAADTGQLNRSGPDREDSAITGAIKFATGDILFGRLRPELNKVWLATHCGTCSPEFRVLRMRGDDVDPEYLAGILRTNLVVAQTRHATTGNTHPRIGDSDLAAVVVPKPEMAVQRRIADVIRDRHSDAARFRRGALDMWEDAKATFADAATVRRSS